MSFLQSVAYTKSVVLLMIFQNIWPGWIVIIFKSVGGLRKIFRIEFGPQQSKGWDPLLYTKGSQPLGHGPVLGRGALATAEIKK